MVCIISSLDDPTLHLPRILCLHGGGTNKRIFRAQCRVLEKALKPFFRFCYAQAPFLSKPGPDVTSVYHKYGPFRAWLDPQQDYEHISEEIDISLLTAIAEDEEKGATGEVVGLLGFSQGGKICGSLLLAQQIYKTEPTWKFAILLAARGPLILRKPEADWYNSINIWEPQTPTTSIAETLELPTIHVHGLRDPGLDRHRKFLHENFDQRHTRVIEWDGEHRVPIKSKDVGAIVEEILPLARCAGIFDQEAKW